jgi:hypothetical protein
MVDDGFPLKRPTRHAPIPHTLSPVPTSSVYFFLTLGQIALRRKQGQALFDRIVHDDRAKFTNSPPGMPVPYSHKSYLRS